jgi:hypothetical protein
MPSPERCGTSAIVRQRTKIQVCQNHLRPEQDQETVHEVLGMPAGHRQTQPVRQCAVPPHQGQPGARLRIVTALSLEKPGGHSDLEKHFLAPLVERVFADYPDLDYVKDLRAPRCRPTSRCASSS